MSRIGFIALLLASAAALPAADDAKLGASRSTQLDGAKVHYTDYGAGDNALVFVHGWSCDETFWARQAPWLGAKFHVITIDLPGHGQSDKPQIAYTMDLYVRAIDAVLRDAKVKAATLVGHSNGTPVIRQFYRKFPEKTRALVIVDGGLRPFGDRATMEKFIARLKGPNYEENTGKFIDQMTSSIPDAALRENIKTTMLRTPQSVGARDLVPDSEMEPHRGQVAIVGKFDLPYAVVCDDPPLMYAIPRSEDCVFGGTNDVSDNRIPDPAATSRIIQECERVLGSSNTILLRERVGLRPCRRSGVRVEADKLPDGRTVIHNYGHGGSGFTLSWGCAQTALELVRAL